jgi:hypothetical protein
LKFSITFLLSHLGVLHHYALNHFFIVPNPWTFPKLDILKCPKMKVGGLFQDDFFNFLEGESLSCFKYIISGIREPRISQKIEMRIIALNKARN